MDYCFTMTRTHNSVMRQCLKDAAKSQEIKKREAEFGAAA